MIKLYKIDNKILIYLLIKNWNILYSLFYWLIIYNYFDRDLLNTRLFEFILLLLVKKFCIEKKKKKKKNKKKKKKIKK